MGKVLLKRTGSGKAPTVEVASEEAMVLVYRHIARAIFEEKYRMECIK
ncbi:MAG: hypothetical protein QXO20_06245 [Candidatus Bathyarchaeia archaeon]